MWSYQYDGASSKIRWYIWQEFWNISQPIITLVNVYVRWNYYKIHWTERAKIIIFLFQNQSLGNHWYAGQLIQQYK